MAALPQVPAPGATVSTGAADAASAQAMVDAAAQSPALTPLVPRELFVREVAQGTAARRERSVTFEDAEDEVDEDEEVKEALATLDSAIARLKPMVDDPEIAILLRKRQDQRAQLVERVRASRPVATRLKRATERSARLRKRAVGL